MTSRALKLLSPMEQAGAGGDPGAGARAIAERLERASRGDRAAFSDLIRIHRPRVQRVALRLVGNHEDAEDVAQETFVRAWHGLETLREADRPAAAFSSWLLGIAVHLSRDLQRARGRRPEDAAASLLDGQGPDALAGSMRTPSAITEEAETRRRVELAIAALPERLRVPFVLRALEGQSYDHVARITGVRAATVRTQLVQARRALRRMLGPLLDEEDGR